MNILESNVALLTIIRKLSMGQITGGETLFLFRWLRCAADPECCAKLAKTYALDETALRGLYTDVLLRLSFHGLIHVESWVDGWAGDDYIHQLTPAERSCLAVLIEEALALHTEAFRRKAPRPRSSSLLAGDEQMQLAMLVKDIQRTSGVQPRKVNQPVNLAKEKPSAAPKQPSLQPSSPIPSKAAETAHADIILPACPSVIVGRVTQPEHFLEGLVHLHAWLNETPRTVSSLRKFVTERGYPLSQNDFQKALDLFYAIGVISPMPLASPDTIVSPMMASNLSVSQFRRACAERFARRIEGNIVLLAAVDHLDCAPLDRIQQVAFGHVPIPDAGLRLVVWEALGNVQRQKKDSWKITQAGRALVAALPRVQLRTVDVLEPVPMANDDDWLDVL